MLDASVLLLAASTAVACLLLMKDRELAEVLKAPSKRSLGTHVGLIGGGVLISVAAFDTFDSHAFHAHEDQMFDAFRGALTEQMSSPLEVPVLARIVYGWVGGLVAPESDPLPFFVWTAIVSGAFGGLFAGLAMEALTRRPWTGWLVSFLMVFHPTLAYWRIHAYPIAFSHSVFCATLLAAVIVVRSPTRRAFLAWFLLGALSTLLRIESAGPVMATAALPLLCGQHRMLKHFRIWLPPLLLAAGLLAFPISEIYSLIEEREDYRSGLRFLALHFPIWEVYAPLNRPFLCLLLALGGVVMFLPHEHAPAARGLVAVTLLSLLPSILFMNFGARHALPATTAGLMLCVLVIDCLARPPKLRIVAMSLTTGTLLLLTSFSLWSTLDQIGARYGVAEHDDVPNVAGLERPYNPMPEGWEKCGIYSDLMSVCETYKKTCHPIKDWRDPVLIRQRWDELEGCILLGVDHRSGDVAGVQHESWPIVTQLYPLAPFGRLPLPPKDEWEPHVEFYRLKTRP